MIGRIMLEATKAFLRSVALIFFVGMVWGCVAGVDLIETGRARLDIKGDQTAYRVSADIREENGVTVISGRIRPAPGRRPTWGPFGHVDIEITSADGRLFEQRHLSIRQEPEQRNQNGRARFRVELPISLPSGTIVTLSYVLQHDDKT